MGVDDINQGGYTELKQSVGRNPKEYENLSSKIEANKGK